MFKSLSLVTVILSALLSQVTRAEFIHAPAGYVQVKHKDIKNKHLLKRTQSRVCFEIHHDSDYSDTCQPVAADYFVKYDGKNEVAFVEVVQYKNLVDSNWRPIKDNTLYSISIRIDVSQAQEKYEEHLVWAKKYGNYEAVYNSYHKPDDANGWDKN